MPTQKSGLLVAFSRFYQRYKQLGIKRHCHHSSGRWCISCGGETHNCLVKQWKIPRKYSSLLPFIGERKSVFRMSQRRGGALEGCQEENWTTSYSWSFLLEHFIEVAYRLGMAGCAPPWKRGTEDDLSQAIFRRNSAYLLGQWCEESSWATLGSKSLFGNIGTYQSTFEWWEWKDFCQC